MFRVYNDTSKVVCLACQGSPVGGPSQAVAICVCNLVYARQRHLTISLSQTSQLAQLAGKLSSQVNNMQSITRKATVPAWLESPCPASTVSPLWDHAV